MADEQPTPVEQPTPIELYADAMKVDLTMYGAILKLGLLNGVGAEPIPTANVRISPQMLHIMARLLSKASNEYDHQAGKIVLPDTLYAELGIKKEI